MHELIQAGGSGSAARRSMLATSSALVLLACASRVGYAQSSQEGQPSVWIELGGQLERVDGGAEQFEPAFISRTPRPAPETIDPAGIPHSARYGIGGEGKISFEPIESDWIFSASVRYGRANAAQHVHQQSYPVGYSPTLLGYTLPQKKPWAAQFIDTQAKSSESHTIVDFQVGKDVGLGVFGREGKAFLNVGVRFAQFSSRRNVMFRSDPDWHFSPKYFTYGTQILKIPNGQSYHNYYGHFAAKDSFRGIGPSLSWNASAILAGGTDAAELAFDWGVNAAVLFGRQKTRTTHITTAQYHAAGGGPFFAQPGLHPLYEQPQTPDHARSRNTTVPNIGGFAGLSFSYANAKVRFGYRADIFFGAMDGGIDVRKTYDRDFYGPYTSISIGLP